MTSAMPRRTTSTRCSTDNHLITAQKSRGAGSGPRPAADIDHVAVTGRRVLVGEAGDQDPAVKRDDLAILCATGRSRRTDIILAARAALEPQFLWRCLVGQMHDHPA